MALLSSGAGDDQSGTAHGEQSMGEESMAEESMMERSVVAIGLLLVGIGVLALSVLLRMGAPRFLRGWMNPRSRIG